MNYRCTKAFISSFGVKYDLFDEVETLDGFSPKEQNHFVEVKARIKEDFGTESPFTVNGITMGDMLNTGIPGGLDMDFTTPI